MRAGDKQLEASQIAEMEETRRGSVPLIFDHSYTERQTQLDRETKWLGNKARELHEKLASLKRIQEDIEQRTRILREKNLELMERNQQLSMGNRQLRDQIIEANSVRIEREDEYRRALEDNECNWEDKADPRDDDRRGDSEP